MLVVPALFGDARDRRPALASTALLTATGFDGFALSPATGTWAWLVLMAIGHGGLFPLALAPFALLGATATAIVIPILQLSPRRLEQEHSDELE